MPIIYTNRRGLPEPMFKAIVRDEKLRVADYSVTELLAPPRIRRLLDTHTIECEAMDRIDILEGQWMHKVLEEHGDGATELLVKAELDGTSISGTIDHLKDRIITDYKNTSVWTWIFGTEREQQLNCYAFILSQQVVSAEASHGLTMRPRWRKMWSDNFVELRVVMRFRDWHRSKVGQDGYPDEPVKTIPVPLWPHERQRAFLLERIAAHQAEGLPVCTDEERWHRPGGWAVMKRGNKRAKRVLPTEAEARTWAEQDNSPGLYLEQRPGRDVRCLEWCPVRSVCDHALSLGNRKEVNDEKDDVQRV